MTTERKSNLPVNVRDISQKQHIVLRLEIIQRSVLEDPAQFQSAGNDPKLSHVKEEIRQLKKRLLKYIKQQAKKELELLTRSVSLLTQWEHEKDLADILSLDRQQLADFERRLIPMKLYLDFAQIIQDMQKARERMFQKYEGYFLSQQEDMDEKKLLAQKSIQKCLPLAEEARVHSDAISKVRTEIFALNQRAMKALATGFGILMGSGFLGWWFLGFWGAAGGFFLGYMAFTNLAHQFAYVSGPEILEIHTFLLERYPRKTVRAFFRYEKKEQPEEPTAFDASRGEYLMRILTKDVQKYSSEFNKQEKKREDTINYIQYLEGRKQWLREQASKIQAHQMMSAEGLLDSPAAETPLASPSEPVIVTEPVQPLPEPAEVIAFTPEPPSIAEVQLPPAEPSDTSLVKDEKDKPKEKLAAIDAEGFAKIPSPDEMSQKTPEPLTESILPQPKHEVIRAPKKQKPSITVVRKINQPPPPPPPKPEVETETYDEPFVIADDPIHPRRSKNMVNRISSLFQRKEKAEELSPSDNS